MKNSKLLSLLTAGALVVSSFSGLVMNGRTSEAATQWPASTAATVLTATNGLISNTSALNVENVVNYYYPAAGKRSVSPAVVLDGVDEYKYTVNYNNTKVKVVDDQIAVATLAGAADLVGLAGVNVAAVADASAYVDASVSGGVLTIKGKKSTSALPGGYAYVYVGEAPNGATATYFETMAYTVAVTPGIEVIPVRVSDADADTYLSLTDDTTVKNQILADTVIVPNAAATTNKYTYNLVDLDSTLADGTKGFKNNGYDITITYTLQAPNNAGLRLNDGSAAGGLTVTAYSLDSSVEVWVTNGTAVAAQNSNLTVDFVATKNERVVYTCRKTLVLTTVAGLARTLSVGTDGTAADNRYDDSEITWNIAGGEANTVRVAAPKLYDTAAAAFDNLDAGGAVLVGSKAKWTLSDDTYVRIVGYNGLIAKKDVTVATTSLAGLSIQLALTDKGKALKEAYSTKLQLTTTIIQAGGAYKGTVEYNLIVNPGENFNFDLVDDNGTALTEITWNYQDAVANTRYDKNVRVLSTTPGINLASTGNDLKNVNVNYSLKTTPSKSIGVAAGYAYNNITNVAAPVATINVANNGYARVYAGSALTDSNTLVVTVSFQKKTAGGYVTYRGSKEYAVSTNSGKLVVSGLNTTVIKGTSVDLSAATITYDGTPITDLSKIKWVPASTNTMMTVSADGKTMYVSNNESVSHVVRVHYMADGVNSTASQDITFTPVDGLTITLYDSGKIAVGKTIDLKADPTVKNKAKGTAVSPATLTWTSSDMSVAYIDAKGVLTGLKNGKATITGTAADKNFGTVVVTVGTGESDEPEPTPVHTAGEDFVDDETGIACHVEDDLTITVTAAPIVGEAITIPDTIDGLTVATIAPQAFKKSSAKRVYVFAPIDTLGKGAFKNSKVKKVYFYDPAALKTVGKNAFKKTNAKVVGVGAAFDDSIAKDLKKAGAKSVKNNGTVK